ncbi:Alpha/beta hydrolase family protein [Rubripirellula amarantea]|uniref:Alpha/beta hydrolase family protein n=1 Tax=Rubripirellula amarantea TaxID=2527999 RepID=A0A5C5WG43_9BACT|nr:alpha/beta fold hydrolase [Rubripirellula amarantea]TWT49738.1 Alpha/beta hydrolase family protein [Rubripirellula amarantea]
MNVTPRRSYRVNFPGGDGDSLAGIIDLPAGSGDAPSPVAVFSHCFTCNKDLKAIVRISRSLAEQGIAVLRFDMTGLGGSEGDFARTNFTSNCNDLRQAIRFASGEIGPVAALIGHSFGGAASLAVGSEFSAGSSLSAIITLAAPSDTAQLAKLLERMNPSIPRDGLGTVTIGGRTWSISKEMLDDFRSHDLPSLIGKIGLPTLVLHSPEDQTVGYDHAIRIMGLINPNASLVTLHGADHLLAKNADDLTYVSASIAAFVHRYAASQ